MGINLIKELFSFASMILVEFLQEIEKENQLNSELNRIG